MPLLYMEELILYRQKLDGAFARDGGQDQLTSEYGSVCEKIPGKCLVCSR